MLGKTRPDSIEAAQEKQGRGRKGRGMKDEGWRKQEAGLVKQMTGLFDKAVDE
jgi:hypothetical protein